MKFEEEYEEFNNLLEGKADKDKIIKEKSFGRNIMARDRRPEFSTKLIYYLIFIFFIGSIVIYILIRILLMKTK